MSSGPSLPLTQVYAMLEYMDDVLGRLFNYLSKNDMYKDTYVLLMGDNGAHLASADDDSACRLQRVRQSTQPPPQGRAAAKAAAPSPKRAAGAELFNAEGQAKGKAIRMPSGMRGYKRDIYEGGVRTIFVSGSASCTRGAGGSGAGRRRLVAAACRIPQPAPFRINARH